MPAIRSVSQPISKALIHALRESSLEKIKIHAFNPDLRIREIPKPIPLVLGYWMSLVLASNPATRIIFKFNFETQSVLGIGKELFEKIGMENPSMEFIEDFAKEYCNLVAGSLKVIFEKQSIILGVSLPMVTKGFDEIFLANQIKKEFNYVDYWEITDGKYAFQMSLHVDWIDPQLKSTFDNLQESDLTVGDIDFL